MHLSWPEVLARVSRNEGYERATEWSLYPTGRPERPPWEEAPEEQVVGGRPYWTEEVPETFGEVHTEVRLHPSGCRCDFPYAWNDCTARASGTFVVETGPG